MTASKTLRIYPDTHRLLHRLAKRERRSLAGVLHVAVEVYHQIVTRRTKP